jgi:hypothetical protein
MSDETIDDLPRDNFATAGDFEFAALAACGDYAQTSQDVLTRSEGDRYFFVMRQSESDRLARIRAEVDAEIAAQDAEALRGM